MTREIKKQKSKVNKVSLDLEIEQTLPKVVDTRSYKNLTPGVAELNESIAIDLRKFEQLTQRDKTKDDAIKKIDIKEILEQAQKDLRNIEHYASRLVNTVLENSVKLKITTNEDIKKYRGKQKKLLTRLDG